MYVVRRRGTGWTRRRRGRRAIIAGETMELKDKCKDCEVMKVLRQYAWNLQKPVSPRKAMEDALEGRSSIA